jgi:hypothetical protein
MPWRGVSSLVPASDRLYGAFQMVIRAFPYPFRCREGDRGDHELSAPVRAGLVRELQDSVRDPAPGHRAVLIAGDSELVSAGGAFLERCLVAVALEHELRCPPNIYLGYHAAKAARPPSRKV